MAYDSGLGVFVPYSGTYLPPASDVKIRSLEANGNFYFTSSQGIEKIDSLTSTPREAGAPKALGGSGEITATMSGFLLDNSAVAYRLVWGYKDANNNLILGAPSQRLVVGNDSGSPEDVTLTWDIPSSITTEYFYQIYRSTASATFADEPSDELQLVLEGNPSGADITAKQFTALDQTPYSLMGATLYTSPSQEGILKANNQPPYAIDMDVFKTCAFYANIKQKQSTTISLISVDSPSLGYLVTNGSWSPATPLVITAIASTADLHVGMRVTGTGIPANAFIASIDTGTQVTLTVGAGTSGAGVSLTFRDTVTIGGVIYSASPTEVSSSGYFLVETAFTPEENIYQTATSLVRVVNQYASNTTVYAYYLSGIEDLPGRMLFEERSIGGAAFTLRSTAGSSFSPELARTTDEVTSTNDANQNRVAISKPGQPEAVPILQYLNIGSANFPILRVVALRDGIFFFKTDGIFRISGEDISSFSVSLVDNTVTIKAAESAVPFNNQVFCFTTQGVCAVTDSGVQIMSVPIEDVLLTISSEQFTNFSSVTFGVAYESARQYALFTVTDEDDEIATQAFVYNSLTQTWTRWVMNRTCGIVNPSVNKLFMGHADNGQVMIERKTYTNADYADEQYAVVITSIDTDFTLTVADASSVDIGMTIKQGSYTAVVEAVNGLILTLTDATKFVAGGATVYTPIENILSWVSIDAENPGLLKQFGELTFFFRNAAFREIDAAFYTNASQSPETAAITSTTSGSWGSFPWGAGPWGGVLGGQIPLRTYVPRDKQRCSWLNVSLRTNEAFTGFSLAGVSLIYNVMSSRFR